MASTTAPLTTDSTVRSLPTCPPDRRPVAVEPVLTQRYLFATAASQVGPQWHAWLHYMNDEVPGQLKGYDGKAPTYTLAHNYNQTGRAGTPQQQPDRYYPAWHVNSRHYKGQFQVSVTPSVCSPAAQAKGEQVPWSPCARRRLSRRGYHRAPSKGYEMS